MVFSITDYVNHSVAVCQPFSPTIIQICKTKAHHDLMEREIPMVFSLQNFYNMKKGLERRIIS